jgi:hypothetical protein
VKIDNRESRLAADRLNDALDEIDRLEAARQAQAQVISQSLAKAAALAATLDDVRRRLAAAEEELAAIRALRTLRWLAPLRQVYGLVRRRFTSKLT